MCACMRARDAASIAQRENASVKAASVGQACMSVCVRERREDWGKGREMDRRRGTRGEEEGGFAADLSAAVFDERERKKNKKE